MLNQFENDTLIKSLGYLNQKILTFNNFGYKNQNYYIEEIKKIKI